MELDRWLGIELRHLAALQAVSSEGSVRAAATRLGYTQSAVSQQLATLERLVGAKLLERPGGPRGVYLTETGRLVLRHAEAIVARLEAAQADVAASLEHGAGMLRIGIFQSAGARILPALLPGFTADWPHVDLRLEERPCDDDLLLAIERGELELTFAVLPLPDAPLESAPLLRDPWVVLAPADGPLAERDRPVTIGELVGQPLIGGARSCRSRGQLEIVFRAHGLQPSYVFHSDENTTVHGLVAAGAGLALFPSLAVDPNDDRVVALPLEPNVPPRQIVLAWHRDRDRSPAARAFVDLAKGLCAELQPLEARGRRRATADRAQALPG
jgi:DNA-binding transcriptional LysR family regulator